MQPLYPAIKTYAEDFLKVDSAHQIYIEEAGNPHGLPVLVVHDGPGTGCEDYHRCFFDPEDYRIILFDQRGTKRSKPHAELKNNTTHDLIADMEKIRLHLNIDQWIVFGAGWGATLGVLYAQKYPEHVKCLVLQGTFLARKKDIQWFYEKGANLLFPDYWEEFTATLKPNEKPIKAYQQRLSGKDELARMAAAKTWALWQARCSSLQPHSHIIECSSDPHFAVTLATIETHYLNHHYFIEDNQILDNLDKIKHIPGFIIHGRYDIVCPLQSAWELHQAWPASELYIVRDAGHSAQELGIIDALILTTKKIAKDYRHCER